MATPKAFINNCSDNEAITIRVVTPADDSRVLAFLREHYYREEPLTVGSEPKLQDAADEDFTMSLIKFGICLMAVEQAGNIVGAVMAGPKGPNEAEYLFEAAEKAKGTKWGRTLRLLAHCERDSKVFARYSDVETVLHTHVLGVDASRRGKAIGARLIQQLMEAGHEMGYPLITVDCTSVYSARLMERLGFDCVNTLRYDEYLDEHGVQTFQPPAPHDCVKTFVKRL